MAKQKSISIDGHLSDFDVLPYVGDWHDVAITTGTWNQHPGIITSVGVTVKLQPSAEVGGFQLTIAYPVFMCAPYIL